MLSAKASENVKTDVSKVWEFVCESYLISGIKTTIRLQKPGCKKFDGNTFTMKAASPV